MQVGAGRFRYLMSKEVWLVLVLVGLVFTGACGFPWWSAPKWEDGTFAGFDGGEFVLVTHCDRCGAEGAKAVVTLVRTDMSTVDFELVPPDECVWRETRLTRDMVNAKDFAALEIRVGDPLHNVTSVVTDYFPDDGSVSNVSGDLRTLDSFSCAS